MQRVLVWGGVLVTVFYVLLVAYLVHSQNAEMPDKLNEIGDFLAGIFGPITIVWLILGFIQQGIELRQNNEALRMQAQELRDSVLQQASMVQAQRETIRHNERASEPLLELATRDVSYDSEQDEQYRPLKLTNTGEYCERIEVSVEGQDYVWSFATLSAGGSVGFSVSLNEYPVDRYLTVSVRYITRLGIPGVQEFTYAEYSEHGGGSFAQKRSFITPQVT